MRSFFSFLAVDIPLKRNQIYMNMNQSALEKAMTVRRWRFIPSHKWPVLRGVSVRKGWLGWVINVCRSAKITTDRKRTNQAFRKPSLHRKTTDIIRRYFTPLSNRRTSVLRQKYLKTAIYCGSLLLLTQLQQFSSATKNPPKTTAEVSSDQIPATLGTNTTVYTNTSLLAESNCRLSPLKIIYFQ